MSAMIRKSLNEPEETRPFEDGKGKLDIVNVESGAVGGRFSNRAGSGPNTLSRSPKRTAARSFTAAMFCPDD
jgi:hypothetical protein